MELFGELQLLYSQLVTDFNHLNSYLLQPYSIKCPNQSEGIQVLHKHLTNIRQLRDRAQEEIRDAASGSDLPDVLSSCSDLIRYISRQIDDGVDATIPDLDVCGSTETTDDVIGAASAAEHSNQSVETLEGAYCHQRMEMEHCSKTKPIRTGMPNLADFRISESTLNHLQLISGCQVNRGSDKTSTAGDRQSTTLQDLGNTSSASDKSDRRLHVENSKFDCRNLTETIAATTCSNIRFSDQDENRGPLPDPMLQCSVSVENKNQTLSSMSPQAPVLSSVARLYLH